MKRKIISIGQQFQPIPTKRIITSHIKPLNIEKTTSYNVGNPDFSYIILASFIGVKPMVLAETIIPSIHI